MYDKVFGEEFSYTMKSLGNFGILKGDEVWNQLPFLIFGIAAAFCGVSAFILPETLGRPLMKTMDEAKFQKTTLYASRLGFTLKCFANKS
jgi:hypothetical protein